MRRLTSKITIGKYLFKGLVSVQIESSWEMLTDTCTITLPRKVDFEGKDIATGSEPLFRKGDKVVIELGYDDDNEVEFIGYIRHIDVTTPIIIKCEDSAFLLKTNPKTLSYRTVTLQQLLSDILPVGMSFEAVDINLGQFRLKDVTPAKVLDDLRKAYSLFSFFKGEKLFVGFAYPPSQTIKTHKFQFERNIIEDELEYVKKEDVKVQVKAISILPDNTKIEVIEGDSDGDTKTFNYYNVKEVDLSILAKEEIERLKYSGWVGSFLAFGQPFVSHGDVIELIDNKLDRNGSYLTKKTIVNASVGGGYRREIFLDRIA